MVTTRTGRPPSDDAEWARDLDRRVKLLEQATTVRIGEWVVSQRDGGDLVATMPGRTPVVLTPAEDNSITAVALEQTTRYITLTDATGGSWDFTYRGQTATVAWNEWAITMQQKIIQAIPDLNAVNFTVLGATRRADGQEQGPYTVTYPGGVLSVDPTNLTPVGAAVTVSAVAPATT